MYNRYIRNDQGTYTRIPEEQAPPPQAAPPPPRSESGDDFLAGSLRSLLNRFHLESVDSGDLLLLLLLFLLHEEDADEELLFALGFLLIL